MMMLFITLSFLISIIISFFLFAPSTSRTYGPPSYPIIGSLFSFYNNRRRLLNWYTDLLSLSPTSTIVLRRPGTRRTIITANPSNVEHILKTNFPNFPKGQPFTDLLGDLLGRGIFNSDGDLWSSQRKLASHQFTTKCLRDFVFVSLKDQVQNRLLPLLEHAADTCRVVDLQDLFKRFAFDVVCKVSLGTDPCCMDLSGEAPPFVGAFDTAAEISAMRSVAPISAVWRLKRFFNVGSEKKLREAIELVHSSVEEIVQAKKSKKEAGGDDLLSRLLRSEKQYDDVLIRDMVISFIMAGRDTTSAAMTWLFWLLSKHADVEESVVEEVNNLVNGEYETLKEMNMLTACLYESMRLYPPVAWDSKHAANDDVLPDGTEVRKGDRVTYFPYGMGRMKKVWGWDRLDFKPERWLEAESSVDDGNKVMMKRVSPYKFPVFQAGPRVCLGKEMALIQMKYVVSSVVRRFEFRPVCVDEQPVFVPLLTAHMAGGFKVKVNRRSS
ncbi:Cytochrome P450 94B3 [Linum perenne]